MKALFDTSALIWAGVSRGKIGQTAQRVLADPANTILVSAASAWEIAAKVRLGKLPEAVMLEGNFMEEVIAAGYTLHAISTEDALRAGRFTVSHRDPFDRMIAA